MRKNICLNHPDKMLENDKNTDNTLICDVYKNIKENVASVSFNLKTLLDQIKSGKFKTEINEAREYHLLGEFNSYGLIKSKLHAITFSGTFKPTRAIRNIGKYTGLIVLDIDKLDIKKVKELKLKVSNIEYTKACFYSPSNIGLKIIVKVNSQAEQHKQAFKQIAEYYQRELNIEIDMSGSDICRLCYFSYDPDLYYKGNSKIFDTLKGVISDSKNDLYEIFLRAVYLTEKHQKYIEGNRNNFVFLLANNCNRFGISLYEAEVFIKTQYNYNELEVNAAINGAYERNKGEFAKFANSAKLQTGEKELEINEEDPVEDYLKNTPIISEEIYEALPDILKIGAEAFTDNRKRDVFLTSALTILSGCISKVTGIYFQERVHPQIYTFVVAPAASGKGVMKNAKRLADKYHQKILQNSRDAHLRYEIEMAELKQTEKSKKKGFTEAEKPIEPAFKIVFIPANCSKARMVEHLQANDGEGIICETEADTMSNAKKQDWGDYSDILRAAFHHEKISVSRKTGNEYIEINEPRLAVSLTGTPAQVIKLIASAEDGLFSRYLFYAYKNDIQWQDPSPKSHTIVFNDHFGALSLKVLELNEFLEESPTKVELSEEQWKIINTEFPKILTEVIIFTSEDAAGVVYRLGLILFRICMIFSALRKFENGDDSPIVVCTDSDFNLALKLVQVYLQHSLLMFNNLPEQSERLQFQSGNGKRKFFDALPNEFTRKQAIEFSKTFGLSVRTVDAVLKSCLGVSLAKTNPGYYTKI